MTTTDLQLSIHEARSRDAADKLYVARDSVLAFLSAPLPCRVQGCEHNESIIHWHQEAR